MTIKKDSARIAAEVTPEKPAKDAPRTDPVCGMSLKPESAAGSHEHAGKTYYFCSQSCLKKFQAEPARYLAGMPISIQKQSVTRPGDKADIYTCPMHPEVKQQGAGSCPKCGMALEPLTIQAPTTKTEYTCPMHPEIAQSEPGFCPLCGMALEPGTVTGE